jgi:DNA topoisomerase-1
LKRGSATRSLETEDQLFTVTLEEALRLLSEPKKGRYGSSPAPLREIGTDPESGSPIVLRSGRFGPYVTDGTTNASLRRGDDPEELSLERAVELIAERRAAGPSKRAPRRAAGTKKAGARKTAGAAKKAGARKAAGATKKAAGVKKAVGAKAVGTTTAGAAKKAGAATKAGAAKTAGAAKKAGAATKAGAAKTAGAAKKAGARRAPGAALRRTSTDSVSQPDDW